ncbi:MAG: acyl-CoA dehydrogenase C-terminal domain-containing protein, partial [Thermoanaerobaculia bacterium]|nr:acyl-CoA dehydrogenase C-terminal domain-containing protein [Thermoanaerobaculia bacterium]
LREVLAEIQSSVKAGMQDSVLAGAAGQLAQALSAFGDVLEDLLDREDGPLITMLNAVPVLDLFGALLGGSNLLEQALIARSSLAETLAQRGLAAEDTEGVKALVAERGRATFLHNKIQAAVHFCFRALPPAVAQLVAVRAGERAAIDAVI